MNTESGSPQVQKVSQQLPDQQTTPIASSRTLVSSLDAIGDDLRSLLSKFDEHLHAEIGNDGRITYFNDKRQPRKIIPIKNKLFSSLYMYRSNLFNLSEDSKNDFEYIKSSHKDNYGIDPNSSIYNYYANQIYALGQAYQHRFNPIIKESMVSSYRSIFRRCELFKSMCIIYSVYVATTFTKRWSKLTSNKWTRLYILGSFAFFWRISNFEKINQKDMAIFRYSSEWEKLIKMHEADQQLL